MLTRKAPPGLPALPGAAITEPVLRSGGMDDFPMLEYTSNQRGLNRTFITFLGTISRRRTKDGGTQLGARTGGPAVFEPSTRHIKDGFAPAETGLNRFCRAGRGHGDPSDKPVTLTLTPAFVTIVLPGDRLF